MFCSNKTAGLLNMSGCFGQICEGNAYLKYIFPFEGNVSDNSNQLPFEDVPEKQLYNLCVEIAANYRLRAQEL